MITTFALNEVRLIGGDGAYRRELVKQYLLSFDTDRLMHTFKRNAGLPSLAKPLGGWEDENCGLRGHFVGHFLSACSKFVFAEHDETLMTKAKDIVDIMELCLQPDGYLSAFKEETLDVLEREENRNVWAPYYTLHKTLQGLIDCYIYLGNAKALKLALNLSYYIQQRFEKLSYWQIDGILRCTRLNPANEFGGMGDSFYTLYELTKEVSLLKLAKLFDRDYFIAPLAIGEDLLENLHANTHLPMIISAMHRYDITGEVKYKQAALHFYNHLLGRTFANGNNSSKATSFIKGGVSEQAEHWGVFDSLKDALSGGESESCCAHNTEKILERLIQWTLKAEYLNHMEILKYNAILNSASHSTGLSQYHQPLGNCVVKKFSDAYESFWCCTGTGIEAMSEFQKNIWFKNDEHLILNSFIASTVYWKEKHATITQSTNFPDSLTSTLVINVIEPTAFTLTLKDKYVNAIKVNSINVQGTREKDFIHIHRIFHDQDRIEIDINAFLHFAPLQGNDNLAAIMYGPILLAQLGNMKSMIGITNENINEKLVKCNTEQLEFILNDGDSNTTKFIPLFRVEHEEYSVYLNTAKNATENKRFSHAKDGSAAYEPQ